jgi:hypothetical protein
MIDHSNDQQGQAHLSSTKNRGIHDAYGTAGCRQFALKILPRGVKIV